MDDARPNLRRIALLVITGVLAIFLLAWLWHYYHTGKITVTTDDRYSTISLSGVDANGQDIKPSFKGHSKLSVTVGTGKYVATVTGNSVATTQTINLKPRQTLRYTINPINTTGVEPVAYENAQAITATGHQLVYLGADSDDDEDESGSGELYKIDSQNNLDELGPDQDFQTVKWASPSFGVGQDDDGHLYTIAGKSVSPLKVPFSYGKKAVNFDVAPNKDIYVSYGADVYAGGPSGGFKKIYTASSSKPALAAGPNQVAVSDSKYGANPSGVSKSLLAVINLSGKKSKKNVESERLAWSPNGQYLVTVNQSSPTIYDASLHTTAVIPTSSVVGQFTWLNNSTLLYSINDQLWTYNLPGQKAQLLANMPLGDSITGLYMSSDRSYIYLTTLDPNSGYEIKRIGLKGQAVPDYIYKLQSILPLSLDTYMLSLINFAGPPTIIIQVPPSSGPQASPQQAMQELQSLGFDTSKLRFEVEQIEP